MKTLDEVITAHEFCVNASITGAVCEECPAFAKPDCGIREDALHYLKEYREKLDTESALPDYYELVDFWAEQQANPPLTWEQLKQMEGKPVWVEPVKEWMLITEIDKEEDQVWLLSLDGQDYDFGSHNWQAYRKERG